MSEIFNALQEALGSALPVSLQIKSRKLLVSLCALTIPIAAPAATAPKLQTPVAGGQKVYSSAQSEPTPSIAGPEHQAQGSQESTAAPPPSPLTSQQAGANQLQVSYEDGKLTIIAENSVLSDVLSAVRAETGADIELPPGASGQRIWAQLGPGPVRGVLATLLDSTNLDYVIRASETDPQSIQSILLILRDKTATIVAPGRPGTSMGQPPRGGNRRLPRSNPGAAETSGLENSASPEGAQTDQLPSSADQPPPSADQPPTQPDQQSSPATPEADANKPAVRTSEQMIQDLQRMYEQRKQMQQQTRKPPAPAPPPAAPN